MGRTCLTWFIPSPEATFWTFTASVRKFHPSPILRAERGDQRLNQSTAVHLVSRGLSYQAGTDDLRCGAGIGRRAILNGFRSMLTTFVTAGGLIRLDNSRSHVWKTSKRSCIYVN